MLKSEREQEIFNILKTAKGFVTVKELCKVLYSSESSIRRSLTQLEEKGLIQRSYGGAEIITNYSNIITFSARSHHNVNEKRTIAKKAVSLINDGNIVFFDQSSTAFYLAAEILDKKSITIVTNNIEIMSMVANSNIKLISSGGILSNENRTCFIGNEAQNLFESIYADIMFFSSKSLSEDGTIWDCSREEIFVRNSMLKSSAKKVFLCDSEKVGTHSAYKQCTLSDVDYLICENPFFDFSKKYPSLHII